MRKSVAIDISLRNQYIAIVLTVGGSLMNDTMINYKFRNLTC
jgi:hypothetical protein